MIISIDIYGVLIDDDTYRLDYMTKYCYENNLLIIYNLYDYEAKYTWIQDILYVKRIGIHQFFLCFDIPLLKYLWLLKNSVYPFCCILQSS